VQARTQQLTASEGQRGLLLNRTHGPNLAAGLAERQENGPKMKRIARDLLLGCCLAATPPTLAQDFKIVWSTVGEAVSKGKDAVPLQKSSKVVRVDVQPAELSVPLGKQVCISTLDVRAFTADGQALAGAPLTMTIREDQKLALQLTRPKGDFCVRPASPGEYPIRFTSKVPAPDATLRGAQIFLRVL